MPSARHITENALVQLDGKTLAFASGAGIVMLKPYGVAMSGAAGAAIFGALSFGLRIFSKEELLLALGASRDITTEPNG